MPASLPARVPEQRLMSMLSPRHVIILKPPDDKMSRPSIPPSTPSFRAPTNERIKSKVPPLSGVVGAIEVGERTFLNEVAESLSNPADRRAEKTDEAEL